MKLGFVFDLDLTLCSKSSLGYEFALPFRKRIAIVNALYDKGHHITIYTARGMNTYRGFALIAKLRWGAATRSQLKNWGVKYHKLILGKPAGDIYVDDKGVLAEDFFASEIDQGTTS